MSMLGQYTQEWAQAKIEVSEFITPEDGRYRVIIDAVEYSERDKDGSATYPTFIYYFTITDGESKGLRFRRYSAIRNEKSAGFIKGDLQKLRIPIPADPEQLPDLFASARGSIIDVNVKSREIDGRTYKDIYIERLYGREQPRPQAQQTPQAPQYQQQTQQPRPQAQQPQQAPRPAPQQQGYYAPPQQMQFGGYVNRPTDDDIPF